MKHGATLVLIGEDTGKNPKRLAQLISERRISIWYSTPSILGLIAEFGEANRYDYSAMRMILFAGEVFPVKHLRALKQLLPLPRYFNLYGPTETNVCTYYEIPKEIPEDRLVPYPIGRSCSHFEAIVVDDQYNEIRRGEEGELLMSGPAVAQGYWRLPERTTSAIYRDSSGKPWYKTGDTVIEEQDGNYTFRGRRDRMVKKRGYRIELGEIETCLYQHPEIEEVGVVAATDEDGNVRIRAFFTPKGKQKLSMISLKGFCAERIPSYMIPDQFVSHESLPRTSTDKVDYQKLAALVF
jgi:acyl-coenzyme A synthetase/AMP-(fatty) acid ligase